MAHSLFIALALLCLHPIVSSAGALILGLFFALLIPGARPEWSRRYAPLLLTWSIIGIGAGVDLRVLAQVGLSGILYTFVGIVFALGLGTALGRLFKTSDGLSILISSGTAICGGSAIAAVSATLGSKRAEISNALIVVFLLNSVALLLFPPIGHFFGLSETQFGLWSALAIHDTSSVVGSALRYGPEALEVGTTVKLARALWILPLTFFLGAVYSRRTETTDPTPAKVKKPWFILGFVAAAALVTYVPALQPAGEYVAFAAKRLFVVVLFLIGSSLSREELKNLNPRSLLQALTLWIAVASLSLAAILAGWVHL